MEKVDFVGRGGPRESLVVILLIGYHDGNRFGLVRFVVSVPASEDSIRKINIDNLPVIPVRSLPPAEQAKIKTRMLDRGKRYVTYSRNPHTMLEYAGPVRVRGEETNILLPGFYGSNKDNGFNWTYVLVEGLWEIKWRADP